MRNQPSFCVFCQLWTMPTRGAEMGCAATLSAALVEWMWSPSPEAAFSSCARSTLRRMNVPALNWRPSASKESSAASMGTDARRNRSVESVLSVRSEEHTSELQSRLHLVCRLLLEKKKSTEQYIPMIWSMTKYDMTARQHD